MLTLGKYVQLWILQQTPWMHLGESPAQGEWPQSSLEKHLTAPIHTVFCSSSVYGAASFSLVEISHVEIQESGRCSQGWTLGLSWSLLLWQLSLCPKSRCTPWLVVCKDSFANQLAFGLLASWQSWGLVLLPAASNRFPHSRLEAQNCCGWL